MPIDPVRDAAIDVLLHVFKDEMHLDAALDKTLRRKSFAPRGRRFLTQLVYGTVRHKLLCDHVLAKLCHQPLDELPVSILIILRMAVFQSLFCDQVTAPAMVHTSVDLAKRRGHAGTARLVNAVLRRVPAAIEAISLPDPAQDRVLHLSLRFSIPLWMIQLWEEELGASQAEALAQATNVPAPVTLRTNTLKVTPEELIKRLANSGLTAAKQTPIPEEVTVSEGIPPVHTKCFREGWFVVQDPASMLPPHLLEPQPGDQVLDLCAAPGGKTTHLAQLAGGTARIVATDVQAERLAIARQNVRRLEMPGIALVCADGSAPPFMPVFDRVLVDAPCSGLGTLRRHPDLKWRMTPEAVLRLAEQQRALLRSGAGLCKNGGLIVYAVCTFSRQETQAVVQTVLDKGRLALEDGPEWFNQWKIAQGQYRILPSDGGLDGFFLTRFRKVS